MGNYYSHKYMVDRVVPETMHKASEPIAEHYLWLWISLGFAGLFGLAMFLRLCCCTEKTESDYVDEEAQRSIRGQKFAAGVQ
jgi:hypothetical protein